MRSSKEEAYMELRRKVTAARLREGLLEAAARLRREQVEDIRRYFDFRCDVIELESWICEKLQAASAENYTDATNLEAKIEKHQSLEAVVAANSNAFGVLDNTGMDGDDPSGIRPEGVNQTETG